MNKQEIIDQWIEDQLPVNPEALGWQKIKKDFNDYLEGDYQAVNPYGKVYMRLYDNRTFWIEQHIDDNYLAQGKISNQGDLRILMKILNINENIDNEK